jgi:hypothetical protein
VTEVAVDIGNLVVYTGQIHYALTSFSLKHFDYCWKPLFCKGYTLAVDTKDFLTKVGKMPKWKNKLNYLFIHCHIKATFWPG